ncbi:hypothetical protein J2X77_002596 [Sphingobacterium sp. 2149]|nr:hypothetical protein [Sphingobacterium sp. 2149]
MSLVLRSMIVKGGGLKIGCYKLIYFKNKY